MCQPGPPSPPTRREPVPGWRLWETGFETMSDPTANSATWLTCHPVTTSTRVAATPLRGPKRKDRYARDQRAHNHISKTVPPTVHLGPAIESANTLGVLRPREPWGLTSELLHFGFEFRNPGPPVPTGWRRQSHEASQGPL